MNLLMFHSRLPTSKRGLNASLGARGVVITMRSVYMIDLAIMGVNDIARYVCTCIQSELEKGGGI